MKRHPFGMAYRINNEWIPCLEYGDKSVAPQPPEDRERIPTEEKGISKGDDNQKLPILINIRKIV